MDFSLGCVKKIYEKHAEPIKTKISNFLKDEWEKFKIDTDRAFIKYLEKSYEKYSKIKTILYRTEPKYIYNFFEYPNVIKKKNEIINSKDINSLLEVSHFLIVQGSGGIGKSTFMKHLFIDELSKKDLIPIFIELKDLNDINSEYEISDFVYQKLYNLGCSFDKKYMEYALQAGCFLFLLDGYDEIIAEKKNDFFKKITDFTDRYTDNYYIISSRPYSEFVEFQRFSVLSICPFEKEQAISLISKIDYDETIKQNFMKALEESLYDKHTSFASNPLLLNIMLLTYDNYAEIPEKLHLFYANAFETLYSKHDATKGGYKRELKSKLSFDAFKKVFSYFCFITYYQGKIEFTYDELHSILTKVKVSNIDFEPINVIYDLTSSICVLYKDGTNYKFTHRSFQEYFTAVFLKELPDSNMNKMGVELIRKDIYRAMHDSTFDMLYDMCQERVEQNIILPILLSIETDCTIDKYDFYYKRINLIFLFERIPEEDDQIHLVMRIETQEDIIEFARKSSWKYSVNEIKAKTSEMRTAEDELLRYLKTNMDYEIDDEIHGDECKNDEYLYNLIKKTWIGERIRILSTLSDVLSKKKRETELDLSGLLI